MRTRSFCFMMTGLAIAHLGACAIDDEEMAEAPQAVTSRGDTIVPPAIARAVAEAFTAQDGRLQKHVGTVSTMLDAAGRTALYGVNFVEGGYVVISGELNVLPILAFSDEGTIDFDAMRDGENMMLGGLRGVVEAMRTTAPGADAAVDEARAERIQWQPYLDQIATRADVPATELAAARAGTAQICSPSPCPPPPPTTVYCDKTTIEQKGPLMTTAWRQDCNFNDLASANPYGPCGHVYLGCTGVASAQVMRYYKHGIAPYYNAHFDTMPNYAFGLPDHMLVRNLFLLETAIAVKTTFGAFGSGAAVSDVRAMFAANNYFTWRAKFPGAGMPSAAIEEIATNHPVILDGDPLDGSPGHMWVVDGTQKVKPLSPEGCKLKPGSAHLYYAHNFGQGIKTTWYADFNFGAFKKDLHLMTVRKLLSN